MSTRVSGPLRLVTDQPAMLVQVMVRAPRPRPHAGGMLVDFTTPATVEDGTVSFPCVPGPAVLSVVNARVPQVTVPLVVPDKDGASLEECIRAAELADTSTRSELEDLARRVVEGVSQAEESAAAAQESAGAVEADRREVASDREAVEGYRQEVTTAHGETLAARGVAVGAAETATEQAETATDRARAAAESAAAAGESETSAAESAQTATEQAGRAASEAGRATEEADRAASEAEASSVKAVAEKVDELTRGAPEAFDTLAEIAEELERSQSTEAALVKEIAGKAPSEHTHAISDVTGLQSALDGKANVKNVPTTDGGYNTRNASDPATDYPVGVSYSMHNGRTYGWNAVIQADTGSTSFASFVLVQTLRQGGYSKSTTQLVFAYDDTHMPVFMRKWYGEDWGPFRSLTDDGHTHATSDLTDYPGHIVNIGPSSYGKIPVREADSDQLRVPSSPIERYHAASKQYVDARAPEVQVVTSLPANPNPSTVYLVTG